MIKLSNCYKTSDGSIFKDLDDAQYHEIYGLLNLAGFSCGKELAEGIMARKKQIINILSLTPESFLDDKTTVSDSKKKDKRVLITG